MHKLNAIIKGLMSQKTRTMLTGIATLCATAILTCLIAFFYATTEQMATEMRTIQKNTRVVVQIHPSEQRNLQITYQDYLEHIRPALKQYPVAASKKSYTHIFLDRKKQYGDYYEQIACDYEYLLSNNITMQSGRFFHESEFSDSAFVIIGSDIASKLSQHRDHEHSNAIFVGKQYHEILGVINKQQDKFFYGQNNINRTIFTHLKVNHRNMIAIDEITVQITNPIDCEPVSQQIRLLLKDHFPEVNYQIVDTSQTAKQIQDYITKVRFVLLAFGFISALIASINISNSMYAIISERLQEIGIRLAIGATALQVKQLLLAETLLLASSSSALGMVLGELTNMVLIHYLDWDYSWHLFAGPMSFILMTFISMISCYIPLMRVDKINPIHAIQSI